MMPLEESFKNTLYYKTENGEYKELQSCSKITEGISIAAQGILEIAKDIANNISKAFSTLSFSFKLKTIKRKRFKKLLMAKGIQRNEAKKIINEIWIEKGCLTEWDLIKY